MKTETVVSTRASAGAEPVKTNLTLNWEGMTEDDLRALAQQALIVKLQGQWRKDSIPEEAEVNVVDHKVGTRAARVQKSPLELAKQMSPEERAELVKRLLELEKQG